LLQKTKFVTLSSKSWNFSKQINIIACGAAYAYATSSPFEKASNGLEIALNTSKKLLTFCV
jgi:hypothetical protein